MVVADDSAAKFFLELRKTPREVLGSFLDLFRRKTLPRLIRGRRVPFLGVRRVSFPVSRLTVYRLADRIVAVAEKVRSVLRESDDMWRSRRWELSFVSFSPR